MRIDGLEKASLKVGPHIFKMRMQQKTRKVVRQDTLRLHPTLNVNKRNLKRTKQFKYLCIIRSKKN